MDPHGAVLSLDEIRVLRSRNEYTEAPPLKRERTRLVSLNNNNYGPPPLSRSGSSGSASSERGLLAPSPPPRDPPSVRTQPKSLAPPPDPPPKQQQVDSAHVYVCESCGRCKCGECAAPRPLPSRLACGGHFVCSADSLVEHGTCMCLVKGLFYHCSPEDDAGDPGSDRPCSLSHPHCCWRFTCMGLGSVLLPCLLCYLPARGCVRAAHSCHDRVHRPGCRCKNSNTVYCKLQHWNHT